MKKRILSIIVLMLLLNFTLFIGDQNYIYANEGVHTNTDGERRIYLRVRIIRLCLN